MTTATVRLDARSSIALDPIKLTAHTPQGVLLSLTGRGPGETLNCAVIPLHKVAEVIANLQLVAEVAGRA